MQAFANIEMNFDFLFTSDSRVSLTFVLLANIVILNYCDRALPINLNLLHKLPEAAISCIGRTCCQNTSNSTAPSAAVF